MARITYAQLLPVVARINRITNSPAEPYHEQDGQWLPNADNFHLESGNDGYQLARMCKVGTGTNNVLGTGYLKPAELYHLMHAFIKGLEFKHG